MGLVQGMLDDYVRQERAAEGLLAEAAAAEAGQQQRETGATANAIMDLQKALEAIEALQSDGGSGAGAASGGKGWLGWATGWVPQSWRGGSSGQRQGKGGGDSKQEAATAGVSAASARSR